jgi:CheY-like chemotaxis protein
MLRQLLSSVVFASPHLCVSQSAARAVANPSYVSRSKGFLGKPLAKLLSVHRSLAGIGTLFAQDIGHTEHPPEGLCLMSDHVLVVDDDRDTADTLARVVRELGYQTLAVYSGHEAVRQAALFAPDLAFIDIGMPDLNGYETVQSIRLQRGAAHLILVALTGHTEDEDKRQAFEAGFDLHVAKPMSFEKLQEVLKLLNPSVPPDHP